MSTDNPNPETPPGFKLRHKLIGHTAHINRIAWSPDGKYLAAPSADEAILIWDTQKGSLAYTISEPSKDSSRRGNFDVAWSPDGLTLVLSQPGIVRAIAWEKGRQFWGIEIEEPIEEFDWSP